MAIGSNGRRQTRVESLFEISTDSVVQGLVQGDINSLGSGEYALPEDLVLYTFEVR